MTARKKSVKKHVNHRARASKAVRKPRRGKALGSIKTPKETIYVSYSTSPPKRKSRSR